MGSLEDSVPEQETFKPYTIDKSRYLEEKIHLKTYYVLVNTELK